MTFETLGNLVIKAMPPQILRIQLLPPLGGVDVTNAKFTLCRRLYIYFDTDERRRFAQVSHEYLIEQLQISDNNISTASTTIDLNFNHPVKELVWCMRNISAGAGEGGRCQPQATSGGPAGVANQGD